MNALIKILSIALSILFIVSCQTEENQVKTGKIQFNFANPPNGRQSSSETVSVLLTISTTNGTVVRDMMQLTLFTFGSGYVSAAVELPIGDYMITSFVILDSENNVSYACPVEGSEQSEFVADALPIYFGILENGTATVSTQVLEVTPDTDAESFGYLTFEFDIVSGDTLIVKDIDNNTYSVVTIGNQVWLGENLKTTRFQNGDSIVTTIPATLNIESESNPNYQWPPDGLEDNVDTYGRLYTQYVASDSRNVCPNGWHVPSEAEFQELIDYLIATGYNFDHTTSGNKIGKSLASDTLWTELDWEDGVPGNNPETNNTSRFNGVPTGLRVNFSEVFLHHGILSIWWSSDENPDGLGIGFRIQNFQVEGDIGVMGDINMGASIRCLKTN